MLPPGGRPLASPAGAVRSKSDRSVPREAGPLHGILQPGKPVRSRSYRCSHTTLGLRLTPSRERRSWAVRSCRSRSESGESGFQTHAPDRPPAHVAQSYEAVILPLRHPLRGEVIAAFVVLKQGHGPSDELRQATIEDERSQPWRAGGRAGAPRRSGERSSTSSGRRPPSTSD